jgi:hypothetical protein
MGVLPEPLREPGNELLEHVPLRACGHRQLLPELHQSFPQGGRAQDLAAMVSNCCKFLHEIPPLFIP